VKFNLRKIFNIIQAIRDFLEAIGVLKQKAPFDPADMEPRKEDTDGKPY
jgi:hypothetical protein